jgi:Domain of unknown function (DUF4160)
MPTISRFFGITVRMYYDDHVPPHFHAYYGEDSEKISVDSLATLAGKLPRRAHALVVESAAAHRNELSENWKLCEAHQPLRVIEPLE